MALAYVFAAAIVLVFVLALRHQLNQARSDRSEGVTRYGPSAVQGRTLTVAGRDYEITAETRAEVVGGVQEGRRSTVTRTVAGGVVAGPVGALAGHAATKKTRSSNAIITIEGNHWTEAIPVGPKSYPEAVRFVQAINLAARRAR